jgi:hypothetical protein
MKIPLAIIMQGYMMSPQVVPLKNLIKKFIFLLPWGPKKIGPQTVIL